MAGGETIANRQGWGVASRHEPGERVLMLDEGRLDPATRGLGPGRVACGRDATPGMAAERGGREIPGLSYGAAAQGIRLFWRWLPADPEKDAFRQALIHQMLKLQI